MKQLFLICFAFSSFTFAQDFSVMTYNIKLDYPKEGENSWTTRKSFFINQLKFYEPDILGVQEAMPNQMKDINSLIPSYNFVGVGRDDGKDEGEYSAIFYKKDKFKVIKTNTFWLSETPDKVSIGWDAAYNRICTYASFEELRSGHFFYVFNTHFDHIGKESRVKSAILIDEMIKKINRQSYPVILSGDFNMDADHESIEFLKKRLKDSKEIAKISFGPTGTFNGFKFNKPVTRRIDYLFVSQVVKVDKYAVLSDKRDCNYPSDHLPVLILLRL